MIQRLQPELFASFQEIYSAIFPEKNITLTTIETIYDKEPAQVWLFADENDKKMTGFLYFWEILDEYQIIDIGVLPVFRQRGIGKKILQTLVEKAREKNQKIFLEVRKSNLAAKALYQACGFQKNGERKSYYEDGEDAEVYVFRR